ncbi:MAG: hypothetical protein GY810_25625 [Aureispira sp.]|nr:hypothetical protein [Aureispira sp.]
MAIYILIATIVVILIGVLLYLRKPQELTEKPTTKVFHHTFDQIESFHKENPDFESQSSIWQKEMQKHGESLHASDVGLIIFSHGTFVGEDPLGVEPMLESLFPKSKLNNQIAKIKEFNHSFWQKKLQDQGYFLSSYVSLFEKSLQKPISCINFKWSSGNHHSARLSGAIRLIQLISSKKKELGNKRVLLIGHSHAGQLFSLVSHLISNSDVGLELKKILLEEEENLDNDLATLNDVPLDFVTLGTPYLYPWPETNKYRTIHFINHRNHPYLAGTSQGVFHTRDGDYIQQWGIAGSDLIASTKKERELNKKLSNILGNTRNRIAWKKNISLRLRVPPYGETHLVDYLDSSPMIPNCIRTIFGHGVYTQYHAMLFNTDLICKSLYSSKHSLSSQ